MVWFNFLLPSAFSFRIWTVILINLSVCRSLFTWIIRDSFFSTFRGDRVRKMHSNSPPEKNVCERVNEKSLWQTGTPSRRSLEHQQYSVFQAEMNEWRRNVIGRWRWLRLNEVFVVTSLPGSISRKNMSVPTWQLGELHTFLLCHNVPVLFETSLKCTQESFMARVSEWKNLEQLEITLLLCM